MRQNNSPISIFFGFVIVLFKILSCLIVLLHSVIADEYHYNDIIVGDRAAGLAGAYVAISDDPAGLFYNPAGIAYAPSNKLSASMNAYHVTRANYKNVFTKASGEKDWVRESNVFMPNFFGITQSLGPGVFGFSYAVTDAILEDQDQTFENINERINRFTINFNNQDTTYNIGPSYAIAINDRFSVGLTLYGFFRQREKILNQIFDFKDETDANGKPVKIHQWENSYDEIEESGIKPIVGFMWTPATKISLGLTFSKTVLFSSRFFFQNSCATKRQESLPGCDQDNLVIDKYTDFSKRTFPWTVGFGAAYFSSERLLLTSSVWLYEKQNQANNILWNAAVGMEWYINERFALRSGVYTNYANTPEVVSHQDSQLEHVDLLGGSISLSSFSRTTSLTLGANYSIGQGKAQVIGNSTSVQTLDITSLTVFLSSSYAM